MRFLGVQGLGMFKVWASWGLDFRVFWCHSHPR